MISKRYVLKRLLLLIPVLVGVATLVFSILHLSPGNPARVIAGERASKAAVREIERQLGLNDPIWVQYGRFLWDLLHLDFGESYIIRRGQPVSSVLRWKFPITLELAVFGQLAGILFGIPIGIISAVKQDTITDHLGRFGALTGISVPIFWSGPLVILLFAVELGWFPTSGRIGSEYAVPQLTGLLTVDALLLGRYGTFVSAAKHLFLPSLVIGIYSMALISRMMRSSMLEVVRQDYIRTARAKGQGAKITLMKHGFRNALIPVVTVIGIQFGSLLGGAVLTETVFAIPGIGRLLVDAIQDGDYPIVQGTVLVFAFVFTLVNLLVDLTYSYLDPRIQQ
ncbi:ABC transporter permease [Halostella sp. JP-L12]|uniref:ABC transporter permease n=1 Tax=Halostella TaxID=1843185 RepID=UPI000EF83C3E|nr:MULTISPECIES: ABC transporter permease [Halostella]NHN48335.1 ABC transporter permease [Halostella sp. JP-L12]